MASDLAAHPEHHHHLSDNSAQHEITLEVYTHENVAEFDEESRKLIESALKDKAT